jgi:hypothetical protein
MAIIFVFRGFERGFKGGFKEGFKGGKRGELSIGNTGTRFAIGLESC